MTAELDAGTAACTPACDPGWHCELLEVTCIDAPCPAQPMCIDNEARGDVLCGTRGAAPCADDEYCKFAPGGGCGSADRGGTCMQKQIGCTDELHQVCGCDDATYANACTAASAGVSISYDGACGTSDHLNDCDPSHVTCDRVTPECPEGQAPSVTDKLCFGECVPIETCR